MRESLKDMFSTSFVELFAVKVKEKHPNFHADRF